MRTGTTGIALILTASLLAATTAGAAVINACAKNTNGKVKKLIVDTSPPPICNPTSETAIVIDGNPAPQSPLVAFARVNMFTNTIDSFGGSGATSAAFSDYGTGVAGVVFTGTFPASITIDKVTLLTTAQSYNYDVSNARVDYADSTQIYITIFDWFSNIGAGGDTDNVDFLGVLVAP